jgi:hypothetical protein
MGIKDTKSIDFFVMDGTHKEAGKFLPTETMPIFSMGKIREFSSEENMELVGRELVN